MSNLPKFFFDGKNLPTKTNRHLYIAFSLWNLKITKVVCRGIKHIVRCTLHAARCTVGDLQVLNFAPNFCPRQSRAAIIMGGYHFLNLWHSASNSLLNVAKLLLEIFGNYFLKNLESFLMFLIKTKHFYLFNFQNFLNF